MDLIEKLSFLILLKANKKVKMLKSIQNFKIKSFLILRFSTSKNKLQKTMIKKTNQY